MVWSQGERVELKKGREKKQANGKEGRAVDSNAPFLDVARVYAQRIAHVLPETVWFGRLIFGVIGGCERRRV